MAARRSGSQVAALLVTGIVATLGVSTVYLPFVADKDKVRGLHEEGELDARAQREYEAVLRQMQAQEAAAAATGGGDNSQQQRPSNSMWSRLKKP